MSGHTSAGDANAFALAEKPSAGVPMPRIQDAPFAMAAFARVRFHGRYWG
jgi:hypothetical protein